jgi:hypothetical protein
MAFSKVFLPQRRRVAEDFGIVYNKVESALRICVSAVIKNNCHLRQPVTFAKKTSWSGLKN